MWNIPAGGIHPWLGKLFDGTASRTEPRIKIKNITNPLKVDI